MTRIPPAEVARRRIIEEIAITKGRGKIVAHGRTFEIRFDDLLDLVQAVEMIMLKLTGKVLRAKFRPQITCRRALRLTALVAGDYSLASSTPPIPALTTCDVTGHLVKTHYMRVDIDGNVWEQWFGRLDELAKCLYNVVREAQGDPYVGKLMVFAERSPKSTFVAGGGNA